MNIIIVLGCSDVLRETEKKIGAQIINCFFHSYSRLMKTIDVYNMQKEETIIICSGYHGQSTNMKRFLIERGIPENIILEESKSSNTIENCILSYQLVSSYNFSKIIVVTNDYHIDRSRIIFNHFLPLLGNHYSVETQSSSILDYIENTTEQDKKDIDHLFEKDETILLTKLPYSLIHYSKKYQNFIISEKS